MDCAMVGRSLPGKSAQTFQRVEQEELLDVGDGTLQEVAENLDEMQRINDVFGGARALTTHLFPRLFRHSGPTTLLDLGTGGGGIPLAIARWARQRQIPLQILAVDWAARNLAIARQSALRNDPIHLIQGDALSLPFLPGRVDYVISSLFLHHLHPDQVIALLRSAYALANRAVIMTDLVRGRAPALAFGLIAPWFARNRLTRHDGALSIRRSYTPVELSSLAERAGLPHARVVAHFPWRMTLVVDK